MANEHYTHTVILKPIICGSVHTGETNFSRFCRRFFLHALLGIGRETKVMRACMRVRVQHAIEYQYRAYKLRIKNILTHHERKRKI